MKLSAKLISAVLLVFTILLGTDAYLMVNRERDLVLRNAREDALFLGETLQTMFTTALQLGGETRLDSLINGLNVGNRLRVVWLKSSEEQGRELSKLDESARAELMTGGVVSNGQLGTQLVTLFGVSAGGELLGIAEVRETVADSTATVSAFRLRFLVLTGVALLTSSVLVGLAGTLLVGRPLARLTAYARRIGEGDLSGRLDLRRSDELGELASAMNRMSSDLLQAQERVQRETEARIAALEQLRHQDRLRTLGRLAAGIAHELGTPLNVVLGRASMISSGNLPRSEVTKCAEIIRNQTSRMTAIIGQLLDFARRRPPKKISIDGLGLVRQVANLLQPIARKSGVRLSVGASPEPIRVSVDSGQIQQVVTNLTMNAIQSMPEGGRVSLSVDRFVATEPGRPGEQSCIRIQVQDEGVGISAEDLPHLFEPFFTTKEVGEGSGLGLSIAHGIVREHGGWITVESKPGQGSIFSVFLPETTGEA